MGREIGSSKRNRCRRSGLPVDSPLALFWDCKNSLSLYEMCDAPKPGGPLTTRQPAEYS